MFNSETSHTTSSIESSLYTKVLDSLVIMVDTREEDFFIISDYIDSQVQNLSINNKILLICESMSTQLRQSGTNSYESYLSHMTPKTIIQGLAHSISIINKYTNSDYTLEDAIEELNHHYVIHAQFQKEN